jgi:hypothetical protein
MNAERGIILFRIHHSAFIIVAAPAARVERFVGRASLDETTGAAALQFTFGRP